MIYFNQESSKGLVVMKKHIDYRKMSKKNKRVVDAGSRRLWSDYGLCSPVSRVSLDRKKEQRKYLCRQKSL